MPNDPQALQPEIVRAFIDASVEDRATAERLLVEYPALRDARYLHGETILHFLAVEDYREAVEYLAAHGFDVNSRNEFGDPPLIDVVTLGNYELAKLLLEYGASPNVESKVVGTPLHRAIEKGDVQMVRLLLEAGADPHYRTQYGETVSDALTTVEEPTRREIVAILAEHGVEIVPDDGRVGRTSAC
jgi:ankyrin repeat protein